MLFNEYKDGSTTIKWSNDYIPKSNIENEYAISNLNSTIFQLLQELNKGNWKNTIAFIVKTSNTVINTAIMYLTGI